jgi:hypothetical protein
MTVLKIGPLVQKLSGVVKKQSRVYQKPRQIYRCSLSLLSQNQFDNMSYGRRRDARWRRLLKHCATNRKVASSYRVSEQWMTQ